jgi:hydrogenase maturation protease
MKYGETDIPAEAGPLLIVGYGNPLCGDDAVGWEVLRRLEHVVGDIDPSQLRLEASHQLMPELAEPVSQARRVLFIDAAVSEPAGRIECCELVPAPWRMPSALNHQLDPQELLAMAKALYGRCPPAVLYTIAGSDFSPGASPSAAVARACDEVARIICTQHLPEASHA